MALLKWKKQQSKFPACFPPLVHTPPGHMASAASEGQWHVGTVSHRPALECRCSKTGERGRMHGKREEGALQGEIHSQAVRGEGGDALASLQASPWGEAACGAPGVHQR